MEIKYKNKPSKEVIVRYCERIAKFLSAHNLSISIELLDIPVRYQASINDIPECIEKWWIKKCTINTAMIKGLEIILPRNGIEENITDKEIWIDAWDIQNQIYQHLGLSPQSQNDPYWKLWNYLKEIR